MDSNELKKYVKDTFNTVADGYDSSAMQYFPDSAKEVAEFLNLNGDEHILDVATGTGGAAFAIAGKLPSGRVTGIDFSKGMLSQARRKKEENGMKNVSFVEMDMQAIDFPDNHFDAAVSAFGIFFVEDMKKQLSHIADKVKNGGNIITTTFYDNSFSPLTDLFLDRLGSYGIEVPGMGWKRVSTKELCTSLFMEAGLESINCEQKACGYYLKDASDWWYIVWNGGFRGMLSRLSENDFSKFKKEHLAEIEELMTDNGIWLEMSILYTLGIKKHDS